MVPAEGRQAMDDALAFITGGSATDSVTTGTPWAHGIFSCADNVPLAAGVFCCPCFASSLYFNNLSRMTGKTCQVVFVNTVVTNCACVGCCYYAHVRTTFRKKYNLEGSPMFDLLYGCCLGPCAVCSDANQLMVLDSSYKVPYLQLQSTGSTAPAPAKEAPAAPAKGKAEPEPPAAPAGEVQAAAP